MGRMDGWVLGIDASRNRSGGARENLIGVISAVNPGKYGIKEIHVWSYRSLLDALPVREWLVLHNPPELEQSLLRQVWWQRFKFSKEAKACGCQLVLNQDAGSVSTFHPSVTMSRDMLSYEPGVMEAYGFSKDRLRLIVLKYIQNSSLRRSIGAVFLTQHAAKLIQQSCGELSRVAIVPHGVGHEIKSMGGRPAWPKSGERRINLLYVSGAQWFKHPWVVVRAVELLRKRNYDLGLTLVGGGAGKPLRLLNEQIALSDPERAWVKQFEFLPHKEIQNLYAQTDVFVFASGCEAFGITLLEGMAAGLPIACSNRSCLPELLKDGGVYFDPENAESIASACETLLSDETVRERVAKRAKELSEQYSWPRCADELFRFVTGCYREFAESGCNE